MRGDSVDYDAIIAGGGPAGLAAAEALARRGCSALVLEQNHEIGSPIRTSGGSFIDELEALCDPGSLVSSNFARTLSVGPQCGGLRLRQAADVRHRRARACSSFLRGKRWMRGPAVRVAS